VEFPVFHLPDNGLYLLFFSVLNVFLHSLKLSSSTFLLHGFQNQSRSVDLIVAGFPFVYVAIKLICKLLESFLGSVIDHHKIRLEPLLLILSGGHNVCPTNQAKKIIAK